MNAIIEKSPLKPVIPAPHTPDPKKRYGWLFWAIALVIIYAATHLDDFPFLVEKDGKYDLSPERKAKLKRELDEIDEAIQYVIKAKKPGIYPCFHCQSGVIYLNTGEIWKYGTTRIGLEKRYSPSDLPEDLSYLPEFVGDYASCLKQEKIKIYYYAALPENTIREVPLIRPPGNKVDR
jgi:hypothetical protein